MAIMDIQGYKAHTEDKVGRVNMIKDAETRLGLILKALGDEFSQAYCSNEDASEEELDNLLQRIHQVEVAKDRLKESSMWACRSVFAPEEKY